MNSITAALLIITRARKVHQDAPHYFGRDREEVRAILPMHPPGIDQTQICFVDQGRRLQSMALALAAHVTVGHPVQLIMNQRDQAIQSRSIAFAPGQEQAGHVMGTLTCHVVRASNRGLLPQPASCKGGLLYEPQKFSAPDASFAGEFPPSITGE